MLNYKRIAMLPPQERGLPKFVNYTNILFIFICKNISMKNNYLIVLISLLTFLFNSCSNDIVETEKEYTFSNRLAEIDEFNKQHLFIENYKRAFTDLLSEIININSQKEDSDMSNLVLYYQRVLTSTVGDKEKFTDDLLRFFDVIYSEEEKERLNDLFKKVQDMEAELINDGRILSFDIHTRNLFMGSLAVEFPSVKKNFASYEKLCRTQSSGNSACYSACRDAYYWELMSIAINVFCYGAVSLVVTCQSLGGLTIPALIALIVEVTHSSIEIDMATIEYNKCMQVCNDNM